jgi:hypothetical protein
MSGLFSEPRQRSKHKSVEWYSPPWVFDTLGLTFDLDPASPHDCDTAVPAKLKYTIFEDGLSQPWFGRVWLNPPYGLDTGLWMRRMIHNNNGIAMVFSRTDASWFQEAMRSADAMLFTSGRVDFVPGRENIHKKGRTGAGTAFFAWTQLCVHALRRLESRGFFIDLTAREQQEAA